MARGRWGVGFALAQDALVTASNPALLLMLGNRLDLGVDWIQPKRDATIVGNQFGVGTPLVTLVPVLSADAQYDGNGRRNFFLPDIGVVRRLSPNLRFGFAIFGNGGLNTDYAVNPYGAFQLQGEKTGAGVDLQQVFVAPSLSLRLNCYFAVGISPNLVYQRVKVFGLQAFATKGINVPGTALNVPGVVGPYSEDPDHVTNQGYDGSFGYGFRVGAVFSPFPGFTAGLGGQPKIHMQRFSKYAGLFPGHGVFDVPTNYGAGLAWSWHERLTLAADVQRILYHRVAAFHEGIQPLIDGVKLGADGGPGFGWRNVTAYKFGAALKVTEHLALRAGYCVNRQPVPDDQTLFAILAPAVIRKHYSAGALIDLGDGYELSAYYFYAGDRLRGQNSIPPNRLSNPLPPASFGGGEATVRGGAQAFGLALAIHY